MKRPRAALVLALAMFVPSVVAAQSPAAPADDTDSPLRAAVRFLPPDATGVGFTDWDRIRASVGRPDITGDSPFEEKATVLLATAQTEASPAGFGIARARDHRDTWGFDSMDLAWEAVISLDGPPTWVLRFRDGVDLAPVSARFDERGFSSTRVDGAVIRSHEMDLQADWIRTTELAILNTAFLDDGRTLVLSSSIDAVHEVLEGLARDDSPFLEAGLGISEVVTAMDGASGAWLGVGPETCVGFMPMLVRPGGAFPSMLPTRSGDPLHPYTALGVAYARPDWDPVGRIVMGFPDAGWAEADFEVRSGEARTGMSFVRGAPYSQVVFSVRDATVAGPTIVLDVAPVDDLPRRLFDMVFSRDMSFAAC